MPGDGGAYFLPRIVGVARALELLWTGDTISAREARDLGIVIDVFSDDNLLDAALGLANRIAARSPIAVSMIKRAVYQSQSIDLRTSLDLISSHMGIHSSRTFAPQKSAARCAGMSSSVAGVRRKSMGIRYRQAYRHAGRHVTAHRPAGERPR